MVNRLLVLSVGLLFQSCTYSPHKTEVNNANTYNARMMAVGIQDTRGGMSSNIDEDIGNNNFDAQVHSPEKQEMVIAPESRLISPDGGYDVETSSGTIHVGPQYYKTNIPSDRYKIINKTNTPIITSDGKVIAPAW